MSNRQHPRGILSALAVGAVAVLVTACGGSTPSTPATSAPAAAGTAVRATLTDYHIALSQTAFPPGTYTFTAVNSGTQPHALEINGPGVNDQRTPGTIAPGQSATLTVALGSGSYDVFCPVDGHKDLGMDLTITTSGAPPATPSTTQSAPAGGGY